MTVIGLMVGLCVVCTVPTEIDNQATKLLELTRTTKATYSLYSWNKVTPRDGPATEAFSAEFHQGNLHRVETLVARIVADCAKMTGTALFIKSGEMVRGEQVAKAACGVNTATPVVASKVVGAVKTNFGPATRVAVKDAQNLRYYDISEDGILIAGAYATLSDEPEVINVPVAVERKLPEEDIFSEASLARIVTPAAFRKSSL